MKTSLTSSIMQKCIALFFMAAMLNGCKSPSGLTHPDSFEVLSDSEIIPSNGFYEGKSSSWRLDRTKSLKWYNPGQLAIERTFINGRLHSANCYHPDGTIASKIRLGSGVMIIFHGDGTLWEKRFFNRGIYLKREMYRDGKLDDSKTINWGNAIPNDGWDAFKENLGDGAKKIFNKKNGKLLLQVGVVAALGYGLSLIDWDAEYEPPPPPDYSRYR